MCYVFFFLLLETPCQHTGWTLPKSIKKIQTISYHKLHLLTLIPSLNSCLKLSTGLKCLLYSSSEHCSFICFYGYHEQKTVLKGYGRIYVCFGKCVFFLSRIRSNLILTLLFFKQFLPSILGHLVLVKFWPPSSRRFQRMDVLLRQLEHLQC